MPAPHTTTPAARRDAVANAVLGNGSLLVTLSRRGEVEQAWWPNLDRDPNLLELRLFAVGDGAGAWLDDPGLEHRQHYDGDASVLVTTAAGGVLGEVELTDVVLPDAPVLLRRIRGLAGRLGVAITPSLMDTVRSGGGYLDGPSGVVVFHRRDRVLAVGLDVAAGCGLGQGPTPAAGRRLLAGELGGSGVVHGRVDGALLADAEHDEVTVAAAFATTPDVAIERVRAALGGGADAAIAQRRRADATTLARATATVEGGEVAVLDRRSQLALSLVTDQETGGVLAGPESDADFERSGGYGFVWSRDLAFILFASLTAGRDDLAGPALRWLARHQADDGLWQHRQWTDGTLAPSWGIQLDETGAVLVAYDLAAHAIGDPALDAELWCSALRAADALVGVLDPETGLPAPSMDLWEERVGIHTYTAATVCAGLRAAARMAQRHDPSCAERWSAAADRVQAGIETHLWSEEHGRFLRSLAVARDDADGAPRPACYDLLADQPAAPALPPSVDPVDATVDVSLLGIAYPFGVLPADEPRMAAMIDAVERELATSDGGLLRYTGDDYIGGNPWILARLWLGLARRRPGSEASADGLAYALAKRTSTDLLPEQVDVATGAPAWVVPLTWSHAMAMLAARPDAPGLPTVLTGQAAAVGG